MKHGYNGWTNWDTWNFHLWLSNDEYLYREASRICKRSIDANRAKPMLIELMGMINNPDGIDYAEVNFQEVFEAFNAE